MVTYKFLNGSPPKYYENSDKFNGKCKTKSFNLYQSWQRIENKSFVIRSSISSGKRDKKDYTSISSTDKQENMRIIGLLKGNR